jgi:uncharacterized protein involved in outer membrane biogenesis
MKRLIVLALLVVALLAVLIVAMPFVVSTEAVKQRIAEQITRWTGRTVTIAGDPQISFFPFLTVALRGVTVANPGGTGSEPFMAMEALTARLKLLPLLIGRTEIAEFRLIRPRINLKVDGSGQRNWEFDRPRRDVSLAAVMPTVGGGKQDRLVPSVTLGRFVMSDGVITYADERTGRRDRLDKVDADFVWPSTSSPASGTGGFVWRGEAVEFNAAVDAPLVLITGGASPVRFALASTPIRLSFVGSGLGITDLQLEGETTATTASIRRVAAWLGAPIGEGSILGAAAIKGKVNWVWPTISFTDATIDLDGNEAEGALTVSRVGGRPNVQATLAFERLDLTAYTDALRAGIVISGSPSAAAIAMPVAALGNLDVRLSAGEVVAGAAKLGRTAATVSLADGKLTLTVGEAQFYGGHAEGRLSAEMNGATLASSAEAKLDGVVAGTALTELAGVSWLTGSGGATIDLSASGADWQTYFDSVSGNATFAIADGVLTGMEVPRLAAIVNDPNAMAERSGSTAFSALSATLKLASGWVSTDDLHAEGDGFAIAASGKASLSNAAVEGKGTLTMTNAGGDPAQPTEVPFAIGGALYSPTVLPDFARLMKRSAAELRDALPGGAGAPRSPHG